MGRGSTEISAELEDALRDLLPFLAESQGDIRSHVETKPAQRLGGFYLFKVSSTAISDDIEDIRRFIEQRYQSVLSAAHRAGWTVLTAAVGSSSGISLHLGFMTESTTGEQNRRVFERRLRGLLPGLDLRFEESTTVETLLTDKPYRHGGIIAGIPTLEIDGEQQHFSFPAVLRGMHGEDCALILMSRPVSGATLSKQMSAVSEIRDTCHALARRTRQSEEGKSISRHEDTTEGTADSKTRTRSPAFGLLRRLQPFFPHTISESSQQTVTIGSTTGTGDERHWSKSISQEEQNTLALELERLAEHHSHRLLKAANVGAWETSITFAAATAPGRDILAGVLLGELAKPSTHPMPPRVYYSDLKDDCRLLLPRQDDVSAVFPRSLASCLTSEELAVISVPPSENLPGYEIRRTPALSLTDPPTTTPVPARPLGVVCDHGRPLEGVEVRLSRSDLAKHLFVCGLTGSGKTTTVKEILAAADVPFLVLESAKRDYRQLLRHDSDLRIFTPGDASIAPLRLNPFHVLPKVPASVHIDYLKAIFNASFSLYGPMPYIVEQCLHNIYLKRGWDLATGTHPQLVDHEGSPDEQRYEEEESFSYFPTLLDLRDEVQDYVRSRLEYRGELSDNIRTAIITRLDSLAVGAKGLLFNSSEPLDIENLLKYPTVLELEALSDDDDKAFLVGLLLTLISEYRQTHNPSLDPFAKPSTDLQHVLVIEEAHRLLKNVVQERQTEHLGNPRGKAVEFFANVISEMRSMGQGVAVVEQIPSKLLPDVIKNTNTKIVHRLVSRDDQALLASTLGLKEQEALYLTSLPTGHALYAREGMQRPLEVEVKQTIEQRRISNERVRRENEKIRKKTGLEKTANADDKADAMTVRHVLGLDAAALVLRFLCTMACGESSDSSSYADKAVARVKDRLLQRNHERSESAVKEFLKTGVIELLANGVFRLADDKVPGLATEVGDLLNGGEQAGRDFRQRLAQGWGVTDAREGAARRLCELALDRALKARIALHDVTAVNTIVGTYFIVDLPGARLEIARQVMARLEGAAWNL